MRYYLSFSLITYFSLAFATQTQFPLHDPQSDLNNAPVLQLNDMPSLADLLTIESAASIFYTYARELPLSEMFSRQQETEGLTLLVPTNKAVMALARKPHQGPPSTSEGDTDVVISDEEYEKNSKDNVRRWVEAHVIPTSPLTYPTPSNPSVYATLLDGKSISFTSTSEEEDWKTVTVGDGMRILSVREASNGVIYLIDGTIDPQDVS